MGKVKGKKILANLKHRVAHRVMFSFVSIVE
jgi:hypothetical protein